MTYPQFETILFIRRLYLHLLIIKYFSLLKSIQDTIGNKQTLNYDAQDNLTGITDAQGTALLTFIYQNGFISKIQDRDAREVNYTVDQRGALTEVTDMLQNKSAYQYDQLDRNNFRLLSKTDPENNTTTIQYRQGQLVVEKVIEPGGGERAFNYDFTNRTFYHTDTRGNQTVYTLNYDSKITSITKGGKTIKKIEYLEARTEKQTDEAGNTITIKKNELYDPISITDGQGNTTNIQYNQYWKISRITDPLNNSTQFTYNDKQQITAVTYPDGTTAALEYDTYGNIIKQTRGKAAETAVTNYQYDTRGNVIQITDPNNNATILGYDQYGHLSKITDANNNTAEIQNDIIGRPLTIKDPLNNTKQIAYDKKGNIKTITDERGNITTYTYDFKGRITSTTDALNNKTQYTYDGEGNLIEIKEAANTTAEKITTLTYDILNRLETIKDPEGNITRYEYANTIGCTGCGGSSSIPAKITDPLGNNTFLTFDRAGRVIGVRDRNGNQTSFAYDPLGRLIKKTYPDSTTATYTYDQIGRLLTAANSNTTLTFGYDTLGRNATFTDSKLNKTVTYEYNKNNNRTKMIDAEGKITNYAYNALNLLTAINAQDMNSVTQSFSFAYDKLGRRTNLAYPNGINAAYAYDPASQITAILNKLNTAQITKNQYTYNEIGNRISNTDLAGTHSYQYDSTYQLTQTTHPSMTEAFAYDKNGNRKTETRDQTTINYTNTAGNRIATRDGETYTHDKNGNIVSVATSTGTTMYTYDFENRLIKANMSDGTIAEYKYDARGRRIEKAVTTNSITTTTRYLYDGDNILAEYDENNNLKTKYTHNLAIDDVLAMERNGQTYYYHKDALGSITAITDSNGNVVQQYEYDAFGNITFIKDPTFIQPFTFTGREYDPETNLYHYRLRTYNSKLGAFMQEDPIGFEGGDVNLFRYVGNGPTYWTDPYGLLFGINAGEGYGEDSAMYYAMITIDPNATWYQKTGAWAGGILSSLWTPCTSNETALTLFGGYGFRSAGKIWYLRDGSPAYTLIDYGNLFRLERHMIGRLKDGTRAIRWHVDALWGLVRHWPYKF